MWEAQRVTPAPQTVGSAGEGLCLVTSPLAAPMPASLIARLGQGDSISLPRVLPEGPAAHHRKSREGNQHQNYPLSCLGRVRIRSVHLKCDLFFTFSFNSIFF